MVEPPSLNRSVNLDNTVADLVRGLIVEADWLIMVWLIVYHADSINESARNARSDRLPLINKMRWMTRAAAPIASAGVTR